MTKAKTNVARQAESKLLFVSERERRGPVPTHIKILNGFGTLPGQHKNWAFNTLLLLYYSQILGLSASFASLALGIALLFDALSDPLVGVISDNYRSRLGRRHIFMLIAVLPTSLSFYALFAPPAGLSSEELAVWMFVFTVLTRVSLTLFEVPWTALSAELSNDYEERTSIQTYRTAVGWYLGAIATSVFLVVFFPETETDSSGLLTASAYEPLALTVSLLMATWMLIATISTIGQLPYLNQPTTALPNFSFRLLGHQILESLKNRNFRLIFFSFVLISAISGTGQVFDVYMQLYFWEFGSGDMKWFILLSIVGASAAFATIGYLQKRFEKQQIVVAAACFGMVMGMIRVGFRFLGIWPINGDPLLLPVLVSHAMLVAYAAALAFISLASMIADIVDENELRTGIRQEGVLSAGASLAIKSTTGLGLFLGGLLLEWIVRFPVKTDPGSVDAEVLFRLGMVDGILVPAFTVIPIFLLSRYRLDRNALKRMQRQIQQRKQKQLDQTENQEA